MNRAFEDPLKQNQLLGDDSIFSDDASPFFRGAPGGLGVRAPAGDTTADRQNFGKMLLVLSEAAENGPARRCRELHDYWPPGSGR